MEWINCSERMPEDDQNVWVINERIEDMGPVRCWYNENLRIFHSMCGCSTLPIDATHWMPEPKYQKS